MKRVVLLFMLSLILSAMMRLNAAHTTDATTKPERRSPVVIELFTSEGCSSCPPADQLLSQMEAEQPIAGVEIIGLEEHVDYWNHDGWTDPYSSAQWTLRQQEYVAKLRGKGPYTPQMIVDGQKELVGNNTAEVRQSVQVAAQNEKIAVSIDAQTPANDGKQSFEVKVGKSGATIEQRRADVWLVATERGLSTPVKAGENKGKTLEHASIVRSLQKIGLAPSTDSGYYTANPQLKFRPDWKKENLRIVVFLQDRKTWRILGAASTTVVDAERNTNRTSVDLRLHW